MPAPALHIVVAVGFLQPVALRFEPLYPRSQLGDFVVDRFGLLSHFQHPLVAVELENYLSLLRPWVQNFSYPP